MKTNSLRIQPLLAVWLLLALLVVPVSVHAEDPSPAEAGTDTPLQAAEAGAAVPAAAPEAIDWLEPEGLNIIDMVGQVPDSYLGGSIITYTPGFGIVRYDSGSRNGPIVTLNTTIYPRFAVDRTWNGTLFSCLGQPARIDQIGTVAPASVVRLFEGGRDVTREVDLYTYLPSGKVKPVLNPQQSELQNKYRYRESAMLGATFTPDGQLIVPANMGCEILMSFKNYRELKAVWTVNAPAPVRVQVVKVDEIPFHSYLGPGYRGHLDSLVRQLYSVGYKDRAENVWLTVPAGADYFYFNFPASEADPYTSFPGNPFDNVSRPVAGTYRVAIPPGLSVDHVNSMGLPLFGHWQDMDQCRATFLTYSRQPLRLATPEYFLPPGIPLHGCMVNGGCPRALLDQIFAQTAIGKMIYLRVDRTSADLERIPLRMVGVGYTGAAAAGEGITEANVAPESLPPSAEAASAALAGKHRVFMSGVFGPPPAPPPPPPLPGDSTAGCTTMGGCGWFTPDGRMVDYIPSP